MTDVLLITADGAVTRHDVFDPLDYAHEFIARDLTVVTAGHPKLDGVHVLVVDDWGDVEGRLINRKAWALYGRSPIYGPALFYRDDHDELAIDIVEFIDIAAFELGAVLDGWLAEHPEIRR